MFGVGVFRKDGVCCYGTNTAVEGLTFGKVDGEVRVTMQIERLDLVEGEYLLDVAVHARDGHPYDYHSRLYAFAVRSRVRDTGVRAARPPVAAPADRRRRVHGPATAVRRGRRLTAGREPPGEATVDAGRLMEEIKERVRERRASGFYPRTRSGASPRWSSSSRRARRRSQDELEQHLEQPERRLGHGSRARHHVPSGRDRHGHRRGEDASCGDVTRPYITLILARQVEFNSALLHLLNASSCPSATRLGDAHAAATRISSLDLQERLADRARGAPESERERRRAARRPHRRVSRTSAPRSSACRRTGPGDGLPPAPGGAAGPGRAAGVGVRPASRTATAGPREEIRAPPARLSRPLRPERRRVLDVGCGRGEFLELCRKTGVDARGVDVDAAMVARCREAGLAAEHGDALAYLESHCRTARSAGSSRPR